MNTTILAIIGGLIILAIVVAFSSLAQDLVKQLVKIIARIVGVTLSSIFFGIISSILWGVHKVLKFISWAFKHGESFFKNGSSRTWAFGGSINKKLGDKLG